jgi:hypothetical protein
VTGQSQRRLPSALGETHVSSLLPPVVFIGKCQALHELYTRPEWACRDPVKGAKRPVRGRGDSLPTACSLPIRPAALASSGSELGLGGKYGVRDLWEKKESGVVNAPFPPKIEPHGAGLYRIKPVQQAEESVLGTCSSREHCGKRNRGLPCRVWDALGRFEGIAHPGLIVPYIAAAPAWVACE